MPIVDVRAIIAGSAVIPATNYGMAFRSDEDTTDAIALALAFLEGLASPRPGCSSTLDAQILIVMASDYQASRCNNLVETLHKRDCVIMDFVEGGAVLRDKKLKEVVQQVYEHRMA